MSVLSSVSVLLIVTLGYAHGKGELIEKKSRSLFKNGPCYHDQFKCSNDECVSKSQFCNGQNDCGDNSDELYCRVYRESCFKTQPIFYCSNYHYYQSGISCIPESWKCDGHADCYDREDEKDCNYANDSLSLLKIFRVKQAALNSSLQERNDGSSNQKWGSGVTRKAVAWYLGDYNSFLGNKTFRTEMAYEVSLSLLSRLALNSLEAVSSTELALYVNAFLVTCIDPRNFYVVDLVKELRQRADASNHTHPFVTLALCNAGDDITERDVQKVISSFWNAHQDFRTDIQALAILALSCAASQSQGVIETSEISELTMELKKKQGRNGTVESLKTTALVMQALFASQTEADEDNFDEDKALKQILKSQREDGSFGNAVNTYYILPVLAYRSLINVSSSHCRAPIKDEKESLQHLLNQVGHKWSIRYSLWIGDNRSLKRMLTLKVPANTSFYGVMEYAAGVDSRFSFEYSMRGKKPYIYSISGIQDDPENSMFWFPYTVGTAGDEKAALTVITQSPADVIPKDGQHLLFWYKSDSGSQ